MAAEDEIYLNSTLAYCEHCGKTEFARIMARESGVFMERVCPVNGTASVKIAKDPAWYQERNSRPHAVASGCGDRPVEKGCPFDCGPCQAHTGKLHLPIFSITNDCNLNCPICFTYNRPDQKYFKSVEETRQIIGHILKRSGGVQLVDITGGEPTLHPELFSILEVCRQEGIGRVMMNTHGLRIGGDIRFARQVKESGVQVVLSLDTFDPKKSMLIHGKDITKAKLKCLENLEALDIPTTILSVCIKGCNEPDVAEIVHTYLRKPFVRSITIQNMTFTGANGRQFKPREHVTLDEVEELLASREGIVQRDFFPLSSYHPMCYSAAYYIVREGRLIALSDILSRDTLAEMSRDSYILNPNRDISAEFREGINRLWANGADDETIGVLRDFLKATYPNNRILPPEERQQVLIDWVKMILIHPHMDTDNFDIGRVSACGDMVPDEQGQMIPACAYNVLYRQKDSRFWVAS